MSQFIFSLMIFVSVSSMAAPYFDDSEVTQVDPKGAAVATETGKIWVKGVPSFDQSSDLTIYRCAVRTDGSIGKGDCREAIGGTMNTTSPEIPEGHYYIQYSNSVLSRLVPVAPKMVTEIHARLLKLKEIGKSLKFRVFVDMSSQSMREEKVQFLWRTTDFQPIQQLCKSISSKSKAGQDACAAWSGTDARNLYGKWIRFHRDGSYEVARFHVQHGVFADEPEFLDIKWSHPERQWVGSGVGGDSIALFSGVYGVEIENFSGFKQVRYGVHVH